MLSLAVACSAMLGILAQTHRTCCRRSANKICTGAGWLQDSHAPARQIPSYRNICIAWLWISDSSCITSSSQGTLVIDGCQFASTFAVFLSRGTRMKRAASVAKAVRWEPNTCREGASANNIFEVITASPTLESCQKVPPSKVVPNSSSCKAELRESSDEEGNCSIAWQAQQHQGNILEIKHSAVNEGLLRRGWTYVRNTQPQY